MNFHVRHLVVDDVRVVHGHRLSVSSGFFSLVVLWFVSLCSRLPMFAGTQSSTRTLWYTSHNSHLLLTEKNTHTEISSSLLFFTLLPMKSSRIILSEMKNTLQMNTHRNRQIGFHFQFIDYSHFWSDRWHWEEASAEHVFRDGNEVEAVSTWFWIFRNVFSCSDAVCVFNDREQCENSDNFAQWS